MTFKDISKLSTRMFKTNPARTWLTILGMGVGTGAVVLLVGLGFGLQGILLEQIVFGETLLSLNVLNPSSKAVVLDKERLEDLRKMPNVQDVSPMASVQSIITYEGFSANIVLQGMNPSYFRYIGVLAEEGELFTDKTEEDDKDKVLLSAAALKLFELKNPADAVGKKVRFRVFMQKPDSTDIQEFPIEKDYYIKGITKDAASIVAIMPLKELSSHFSIPYYERAQVRVSKSEFLNSAQEQIINKGFNVTALSKTIDQANKIFAGIQAVLAVFGGIALVVSAIGMFNTMTVTLLERTNEIGIMRTIGASSTDIKILFLAEAVVVGFLGGVIGILLGVGIGTMLNLLLNTAASYFGGKSMSMFRFPILFLLFISAFSAIVGFLTGLFPAKRAAALNPLDAIRYK